MRKIMRAIALILVVTFMFQLIPLDKLPLANGSISDSVAYANIDSSSVPINELSAVAPTNNEINTVTVPESSAFLMDTNYENPHHKITGYIKPDFNFSTNEAPLVNSELAVEIAETDVYTVVDSNGYFEIKNIPERLTGYKLKIRKTGYLERDIMLDTFKSDIQIGTKESPVLIGAGDLPINGEQDMAINMSDIMVIAGCFNSKSSDATYVPECDFNADKAINMSDIMTIARNFNKISATFSSEFPLLLSPVSTLNELKEKLTEEFGNKTETFTVTYTGDISNLDTNLNGIITEVKSQEWIAGTVKSSSFVKNCSAGNMSITFSMQYILPVFSTMEQIKNRLSAGMQRFETKIEFETGMNINQVYPQLEAVTNENLDNNDYLKFKCKSYSFSAASKSNSYVVTCTFEYDTTKQKENYLTNGIKAVLSEIIKPEMDIHQKEKSIHDYITSNIAYDDQLTNNSAFDAFINKKATCQGYAELTYRMLVEAGFEAKIVVNSDHAWNLVKLEGLWFHLDCTWDSKDGEAKVNFYNLSDTEMKNYHSWTQADYPPANTNYINYIQNKSSDKYITLIRDISLKESEGIVFVKDELYMHPGNTKQLGYEAILLSVNGDADIQWSSSNTAVASVQDGVVTAVSTGTATITAILGGKYTSQCTIVVVPETELIEDITGIKFKEPQINMNTKETKKLAYSSIPDPDYPGNILWFSSNPYIASVKDGNITAFSEGTVTITAILDGSYVDTCQVNITRKVPLPDSSQLNIQTLSEEVLKVLNTPDNQAKPGLIIRADGNINQTTRVADAYGEFKNIAGVVGHPISIETDSSMEYADISFDIDSSVLTLNKFDDLVIAWHDPVTDSIIPVETSRDSVQKKLSARITHFSTYMVINNWVLDQIKKKVSDVQNLLKAKQADLVVLLDNKWSEDLSNAKQNIKDMVESIDASVDLNVNFRVVNKDGSIGDYGWYTNKARPKLSSDYPDTSRLDDMKTLRQFKEDLDSIASAGYSTTNYPSDFTKTASQIFTKAYTDARKQSGFRSGVSKFIFGFSEMRATGIFEVVKNSVMVRENETLAMIQRDYNGFFNKYSFNEGTSGIFNLFNEPVSRYIVDKSKEKPVIASSFSIIINNSWSQYTKSINSNASFINQNGKYLEMFGRFLIDTASYLVDKTENMPGGFYLSVGNHAIHVQNGVYKIIAKSGDTLESISKIVTGNSTHWKIIYSENKLTNKSVTAGQELDITRILSDEKIALAIAEKITENSALLDYFNNSASDVVGDIELYRAKLQLKDLMGSGKKLYNGNNAVTNIDITNNAGLYDGIWDSKFDKAVKAFMQASNYNLQEVYNSFKTIDDKKTFLIHWIYLDWESWNTIYVKGGKIENGMSANLYPAPKKWYENMPDPPKTDSVKGLITKDNKDDCISAKNYFMRYMFPIERTCNWQSPTNNLLHSWLMRTYGVSGDDKGGILGGTIEGLFIDFPAETVKGVFTGIWDVCKDPAATLESIKFMMSCIYNGENREMLITMIETSIEGWIEEFGTADTYEQGKMIGKLAGEVILCIIGVVKAVKTGVEIVRGLKAAGSLINYIRILIKAAGSNLKSKTKEVAQLMHAAFKAINKLKSVADDFLNFISGNIMSLRDGFAFRPAFAGVSGLEDVPFSILKYDEISDASKVKRLSSSKGRLLDIDDVAPDIAFLVKSVENNAQGTMWTLKDASGAVIKRIIKPEGFKSVADLLDQARRGIIDVRQWGYSNVERFEEAIRSMERYISSSDNPILMNSRYAGKIYNGIEFDILGMPIFRGADVLDEVELLGSFTATQLGGMSRPQHLCASTKMYRDILLKKANSLNMDFDSYLENVMKFNLEQRNAIKASATSQIDKIPGYTWHHHQETGRMQLVDETVHGAANHTGGTKFWGRGD